MLRGSCQCMIPSLRWLGIFNQLRLDIPSDPKYGGHLSELAQGHRHAVLYLVLAKWLLCNGIRVLNHGVYPNGVFDDDGLIHEYHQAERLAAHLPNCVRIHGLLAMLPVLWQYSWRLGLRDRSWLHSSQSTELPCTPSIRIG